ncbi:MAG: hypothetical protein CME59_05140 [Halioglobus sp.]|nr:hypothetical protein [Halioglobus sp.]
MAFDTDGRYHCACDSRKGCLNMASKQLVLHVGLHKTATSSFQVTCGQNQQALMDQGICYPRFTIGDRTTFNHGIPVFILFSDQPQNYNVIIKWGLNNHLDKIVRKCEEQLDAVLDGHESVLLSGEDVSLLPATGLDRLNTYLRKKDYTVRVLCSVRKPYSFTCSEVQQKIRGGRLRSIEKIRVPRKSLRIKTLRDTFDKVEFFSFEKDLEYPGGPVAALLDRAQVKKEKIEIQAVNEGLGNITTRLYAAINREYPVILHGRLNPDGREPGVRNFDDNKFLLTRDEIAQIRAQLDRENAKIAALLGAEFTDSSYPFSESFTIDLDTAARMLTEVTEKPHVRQVVKAFLLRHGDSSWSEADLLAASHEADRRIEQNRMQADEAEIDAATPETGTSTLVKLWRAVRSIKKESR